MLDQLEYLFLFYRNPRRAAGLVLDHGQFLFGLIAAVVVTLTLSAGASRVVTLDQAFSVVAQAHSLPGVQTEDEAPPQPGLDRESMARLQVAMAQAERRYFGTSVKALIMMAIIFVPVSILILATWDHLGGGMTILFRDFMPVLTGLLFAWSVAQLPFAVAWWVFGFKLAGTPGIALQLAAALIFALFAGFVLSTVMGVTLGHASIAGVASLGACFGASYLFAASAGFMYMFASPWVLYYLYQRFSGDISSLGGGLSARQNFKRQLEAATLNPRDADAHYQLGLVYAQRRSFTEAEASFRRALEINPKDAETLFQLGKLIRQQPGRSQEAIAFLEQGVQLDPRLGNYEVWRELGALALEAGRADVALPQLEHYVSFREYDPEGLVLLGQALRAANREPDAKAAFEKAILAVKTAPSFRRSVLRRWESQARQELRGR